MKYCAGTNMFKVGQKVKVRFFNEFHNTSAIAVAKIVHFGGDYWTVELPIKSRQRVEKKLCGMADCYCKKITSAELYCYHNIIILLTY